MTQPSSPSPRPPSSPKLAELLARLRAEQAASLPASKPLLSHELGVAQEQNGDDAAASRDFLAAFNGDPRFREPLEALLRLLSRRSSPKSLGKLLDALSRAAETPEEKARALCQRGAFLLEHVKDDAGARLSFEAAIGEAPDDPTAWLEIELLAAQQGDPAVRARALEARSALTKDPGWRGLLLIDRANLELGRGNVDVAIELLESARQLEGIARYPALRALEALASSRGRVELLAQALEAQGELAAEAMADPSRGDALGVPRDARAASAMADSWLRAAEARRSLGDVNGAAACLDRALAQLPDDAVLRWKRLTIAEARGEAEASTELAQSLLARGAAGPSGASLGLRLARARDEASGRGSALDAVRSALELSEGCIPARLLQLDLLADGDDPAALAQAIEAYGETLGTDAAKARAYLLAAHVHALEARDAAGAKAALAQAAMASAPPAGLARAARLFATLLADGSWYEEATSRLTATMAAGDESASLWFELSRLRLLARNDESAQKALASLAASPGGAWLGNILLAHARSSAGESAHSPEAIDALARSEADPALARALTIVAATRAHALGDIEGAKARLLALCEADAVDEIAAVYLADLERLGGNPRGAAKVLARAARAAADPDLATTLHLESFALGSRSGDPATALDGLESLAASSKAASGLLTWALSAAAPNDTSQRKRALRHAVENGEDSAAIALEQLGLSSFVEESNPEKARDWLDVVEREGSGGLLVAAALARLVSSDAEPEARTLATLASLSPDGAALAASERLRLARARGDREAAKAAARDWAEADGTLVSRLEWLGASFGGDDREVEALARDLVAETLDLDDRAAIQASAAAVRFAHAPGASIPQLAPTDAASRLMNLELAPLGSDPRRRARALTDLDDTLGADVRIDALLLAGTNQLAAGDAAAALLSFQQVTEARPDELWGWEGVRAAAEALEDPRSFSIACAHLGELCRDDARGAEFWEQAGLILLDRLREPRQAELALEQAFTRDPTRSVAFDRLFRQVREAGDHDKLLSLIARRLEVADDPAELAKLFWEQARGLRQKGNREEAILALESVTAIEPDHVGALALSGEILITQGKYAEAAQALARLATLPDAPDRQRLMSGVAAVDLYENKLGDSMRALEVLVSLHEAGLSNLPVRERLARAAAKTGSWRHAASIFEELMNDRATSEGRIEAARLAMVLWRDKLDTPAKAERAVTKLLAEAPGDPEGIDVVLASPFDPALKQALLESSRDALVRAIAARPTEAESIARLAAVARGIGDLPLRQASLGALIATGRAEPGADAELADLDQRVAAMPQIAVDDAIITRIADPEDAGPIARLFEAIAEPLAEALGPSLAALEVGKKERIDPRAGFPVRNEIAAWAGALGLEEVNVYVGGPDPEGVQGIAGETPSIVIGTSIRAPLAPRHRQAIARELFALRRGIGITRTRDETTVAAIVVAACNLADVPIDAPPYALLGDVQRQLAKTLSRKTKKLLPALCRELAASAQDPKRWARAAQVSMYRMAAIAAGDVSFVLEDLLDQPRQQLASAVARDERAQRLIAFVLSPHYLELRARLGMGIK